MWPFSQGCLLIVNFNKSEAVFHLTISLPVSARDKYCSMWTVYKCWQSRSINTSLLNGESVASALLLALSLSLQPLPTSVLNMSCRWQRLLVPKLLLGGALALETSLGSSSSCFSKLGWGARLASRILHQVQCGLHPLAAGKRPFVSCPSPSARMWCTRWEWWKFPHHPQPSAVPQN